MEFVYLLSNALHQDMLGMFPLNITEYTYNTNNNRKLMHKLHGSLNHDNNYIGTSMECILFSMELTYYQFSKST